MFLTYISGILSSGIVIRIIEKMESRANTIERMLRIRAAREDLGSSNSLQICGFHIIHQVIFPTTFIRIVERYINLKDDNSA